MQKGQSASADEKRKLLIFQNGEWPRPFRNGNSNARVLYIYHNGGPGCQFRSHPRYQEWPRFGVTFFVGKIVYLPNFTQRMLMLPC
jgi:hypothetical protein